MYKDTFYLAYGSNLNVKQMSLRCPSAKVYGVSRIPSYRLTFKALGSYAYATIEPCEGAYVPIAVWRIEEMDEFNLDKYEGYPTHYKKQFLEVMVGTESVDAMVYVMNDQAIPAIPAHTYFETVLSGYRSFGLEEWVLYEALYGVKEPITAGMSMLAYYRSMRRMTQMELANDSGVSVRSIQKYESGERLISKAHVDTIIKLAETLNIPLQRLVFPVGTD